MAAAPEPDDARAAKARRLARMKAMALLLLLGAAVLYGVATLMQARQPGWRAGWAAVAAFSEAAMIGAMADWFAVVALFRHPLRMPIPHTAIIPRNQGRIGENLAAFICDHFLGAEHVLRQVRALDPARRLAEWLADDRHAEQAAGVAVAAARQVLGALDDQRVAEMVQQAALHRLQDVDVASWAGRLLAVLTEGRRHQALLDEVLRRAAVKLGDEALQAEIAERIAAEVQILRVVGLDQVAGRMGTRKLLAGLGRLIAEMGEDPNHPLRQRLDAFMAGLVEALQHDPAMRTKAEAWREAVLRHEATAEALQQGWQQALQALQRRLQADDRDLHAALTTGVRAVGTHLVADLPLQAWINGRLMEVVPAWAGRWREDVRRHITERVADWPPEELARELELHLGPDLQYVRFNGTLVGGLIGLVIHLVTNWLMV